MKIIESECFKEFMKLIMELANKGSMPKEERIKIIDQLVTNQQIKKILISGT